MAKPEVKLVKTALSRYKHGRINGKKGYVSATQWVNGEGWDIDLNGFSHQMTNTEWLHLKSIMEILGA